MKDQGRAFSNPQGIQPARDPFPADARPEIFCGDILGGDPDLWVPQGPGVSFLPLCLGVTEGYYVNLLRVRKSGVLSCHRHTGTVHAHVLKGRWFYMEHAWVASAGSYVMESPGETHTLVVPDDVDEMITWFHVTGGYIYFDGDGRQTGYEDVFTKIDKARAHYRQAGIDQSNLDRLLR
ncbi:2,4'-dihydroxyacetophenone dioxygenase family protein [Caenimonas terrae]|uniref:2,4'-dihydroxyacetophenone dioxygenase family protein n=1 Tax=Caenimonas terrae TaxID=696074 RepID=A0ABW0NGX8_9BURK